MKKNKILLAVLGTVIAMNVIPMTNIINNNVTFVYAEELSGIGVITGDGVNVRSGPSKDEEKLGSINGGEEVTVTGKDGSWYQIEYNDGAGYVSADYVDFTPDEVKEEEEVIENTDEESEIEELEEEEEIKKSPLDVFGGDMISLVIIGSVVILIIIITTATIVSIKRLDDDDEFDDYDDYDDDYEDDYDDDYDDGYDDDYDDDEYYEAPRRKQQTSSGGRNQSGNMRQSSNRPVQNAAPKKEVKSIQQQTKKDDGAELLKYMSNNPDDYRIDIDPKFFETTTLPTIDDADAPKPVTNKSEADVRLSETGSKDERDEDIAEAMKKMEELKKEIERLKKE